MRFDHRDCGFSIVPLANGELSVQVEQSDVHQDLNLVFTRFTAREWRTLSRHVEEALREAALLRRRAKSADRRKRDAMKGTR